MGKSTLFAALSGQHVAAENYPFCTIEPNKGLVPVPDERLSKLSNLIQPDTTTPTIVQFVDVAGLVKGASRGEGLGNQFLANLRECTALVHIIRCFEDENIVHTEGMPNPLRDKDIIDTELQLKDIETVSKRLSKTQKVAKSGDKELKKEVVLLQEYLAHLEKGHLLRTLNIDENTRAHFKDLTLLTEKPVLYVANVAEKDLPHGNSASARLGDYVAQAGAHLLVLSAATEAQIAQLPPRRPTRIFAQLRPRSSLPAYAHSSRLRTAGTYHFLHRRQKRSPGLAHRFRHSGTSSCRQHSFRF